MPRRLHRADLRYVATAVDGGDDSNPGSEAAPMLNIATAVADLKLQGTGGTAHRTGVVRLGGGVFEPPAKILYASEIVFEGIAAGVTDGARGVTVIKMADNFDDDLFDIDPAYTDWAHFVSFRHIAFEGNKENQAGFGVERFLDADNSETLTFAAGTNVITRSGVTSFITQGYADGMKIRVHGTVLNNGIFTIAASGVTASTITTVEALAAEGPLNGCGIHASPFSLVRMTRPGFQTYFEDCLFRNAPAYGTDITGSITNLNYHNCGWVKCHQGAGRFFLPDTSNLCQLSLTGTSQIDDCGPAPLFFEDRGDGGVNVVNIHGLECESAITADIHDAIVRYHKIDGNNPMAFNIGTINAFRSGGLGNGRAVVHEMVGGAARWNIWGGLFKDGYTDEFRSDHRNFSIPAASGQQTGQPILFGIHTGPRSSFWLNKTQVFSGNDSPEGVVTANPGSWYFRDNPSSGAEANNVVYVKLTGTGNTGWVKVAVVEVIATASLPAGSANNDGRLIIEDGGAGVGHLISYKGGQRFRHTGALF